MGKVFGVTRTKMNKENGIIIWVCVGGVKSTPNPPAVRKNGGRSTHYHTNALLSPISRLEPVDFGVSKKSFNMYSCLMFPQAEYKNST